MLQRNLGLLPPDVKGETNTSPHPLAKMYGGN